MSRSQGGEATSPATPKDRARHASRGRRVRWVPIALVTATTLVAVAITVWLATSWLGTYHQARLVQNEIVSLRDDAYVGRWEAITTRTPEVARQAKELAASTSGLPWQILTLLPWVGSTASAAQTMAVELSTVVAAAAPLAPMGDRIVNGEVRAADGSIDLSFLERTSPLLYDLAGALDVARQRLSSVDLTTVRPELAGPLRDLTESLTQSAPVVAKAASVVAIVPNMLGSGEVRDWLVLLQNPAESRGSGGFIGGYGILRATNGLLELASTGTSADLSQTAIPTSSAPQDARMLWGGLLQAWNTYNLTPDFPLTAELSASGMRARSTPISGVIAIDPATVSRLLAVTGPVSAGGYTISADNAVQFFTQDIYTRISDDSVRNEVSMELVKATFEAMMKAKPDVLGLIKAFDGSGVSGGLRMWSSDPKEQAWLETTEIAGVLPPVPGPVVAVAFNNAAGSKTDAFVQTSVRYAAGKCVSETRVKSTLEVSVRNGAPPTLPLGSVYGRLDDPTAPPGSTNLLVHIYAPLGATFGSATIDGKVAPIYVGAESNRPVWWTFLPVDRGQERVLHLEFSEPSVLGTEPKVIAQSMVLPEEVNVTQVDACEAVQ